MALPPEEIPFAVRTAEQHTEDLLFSVAGLSQTLTDLNPGGIARSIFEAVAIQLEKLDTKTFFGILKAIPVELYTAFDFLLLAPVKAMGTVTFVRSAGTSDIIISVDTQLRALATELQPGVLFSTIEEKTIAAGESSIDVPVAADVAGAGGNVSAGRITTLVAPIADIGHVSNPVAFRNGRGQETEDERAVRFRQFVQNLARSPLAGLQAGALTARIFDPDGVVQERAVHAIAIEPTDTLGRVDVYLDNGGGTSSTTLVEEAQRILDGYHDTNGDPVLGYKAAGIAVTVHPIRSVPIAVSARIEIEEGFNLTDVRSNVQENIENYFSDLGAGGELVYADLLSIIVSTPGVRDAAVDAPASNQNTDSSQRLLAGTVTITEL